MSPRPSVADPPHSIPEIGAKLALVLGIGRGQHSADALALLRRTPFGFPFLLQPEACKLQPRLVGIDKLTAIWATGHHLTCVQASMPRV
jgi:hypothetical protein